MAENETGEFGPMYNVPLIDSLPIGAGGMRQAMPTRQDLDRVCKINARTAAGYEVLLAAWHNQGVQLAQSQAESVKYRALSGDTAELGEEIATLKTQLASREDDVKQAQSEREAAQAEAAAMREAWIEQIKTMPSHALWVNQRAWCDWITDTRKAMAESLTATAGQSILDRLLKAEAIVAKLPKTKAAPEKS